MVVTLAVQCRTRREKLPVVTKLCNTDANFDSFLNLKLL